MRLVTNKQPKHDDQSNVEQHADVDVTAPAAAVTFAAAVAEVSAEISVASLQKQHAEAVAAEQSLASRRDQLAADIASRQRIADAFGELAALGDQAARGRNLELRQEIADFKIDFENTETALARTKVRERELFHAHDSALANQQRAAASVEVSRRLDEAIDADRVFFSHLAQIATSAARLTAAIEALRAPELQIAPSATSVRQKLSDAHSAAFDALPPAVRSSWGGRTWGGPQWIGLISKDAALL